MAVGSKGMMHNRIAGAVMFYAKSYLPLNGRQPSFHQRNPGSSLPISSDVDQRTLIEEMVGLLPIQEEVTPTNFLLRLLRTSMILHASPSCQENLERRIGAKLDRVVLEDLLIPNIGDSEETLYDLECVQRIVNHFMFVDEECTEFISNSMVEDGHLVGGSHSLTPMTMVANLLDNYLAEVAPDVNLKLEKFVSLAAAIPDYAMPLDDGIYWAVDIYLKAHPHLTDSEKEHLCRLMNCQKFSLEASTHAAKNERLPLRVTVQVLFFEQLRLRTSVAGWLFVSDNVENSQNLSGNFAPMNDRTIPTSSKEGQIIAFNDIKERVSNLEKECDNMKYEIEKLVKTKGSWNNFYKRYILKFKPKSSDLKSAKIPCSEEISNHQMKDVSWLIEYQTFGYICFVEVITILFSM